MVFNLTHSQLILRYKENGGRIEPYTIVIMITGVLKAKNRSNFESRPSNGYRCGFWPQGAARKVPRQPARANILRGRICRSAYNMCNVGFFPPKSMDQRGLNL
jgi:hypothetical protein